jgi:DEAD/DEAH box helicase domain-containing protein
VSSSIESVLAFWRRHSAYTETFAVVHETPQKEAVLMDFPPDMPNMLATALHSAGISSLFSHQKQAWELTSSGRHVLISSGTSSGKSLCYQLPILARALSSEASSALLLFPTKALANDQLKKLTSLIQLLPDSNGFRAGVYDGDTPTSTRQLIRTSSQFIITNPDMLHTGILPHHTKWEKFIRNLKYVVLDEIHTYRGVFGSHVANVIRRLKRICQIYGSFPQFILTSATIGNAVEHGERLISDKVAIVTDDGSPQGEKTFIMCNPPIVYEDLGVRRSAFAQSLILAKDLVEGNAQTIVFCGTRKAVESSLIHMGQSIPEKQSEIAGYRSGYLSKERRVIEKGLRDGSIRLVFATNALELGMDIGSLDASILVGYPGTISSTRQQAGRAGRRQGHSIAILVASGRPIDQYLIRHSEYLFSSSPESAFINPDNLLILMAHIKCAAFESPIVRGQIFGDLPWEKIEPVVLVLEKMGFLYRTGEKWFWLADGYPSSEISLRVAGEAVFRLIEPETEQAHRIIGEVDEPSAFWMIHPGAIYMHTGHAYEVKQLDIDTHTAILHQIPLTYTTEAIQEQKITRFSSDESKNMPGAVLAHGEIVLDTTVSGFRQLDWETREILSVKPLSLPTTSLLTEGFWLTVTQQTISKLEETGLWKNSANDYGPEWSRIREFVIKRDLFTCRLCGKVAGMDFFHVHHLTPFKQFHDKREANRADNLVTLCPSCHRAVEQRVHIRSGMAGMANVFQSLSPFLVMADPEDIGVVVDQDGQLAETPSILLYDRIPAGIGLALALYHRSTLLIEQAFQLVQECSCLDGCPSCVGPVAEEGSGGKAETLALLELLSQGKDKNGQ